MAMSLSYRDSAPKEKKNKNQKIMTGISTQFTKGMYLLRFQTNIYYIFLLWSHVKSCKWLEEVWHLKYFSYLF